MESNRDIVIRALRAASAAANSLLDVRKYQSPDRAFLQLATQLIAEAEIIIAHCQWQDVRKKIEGLQKDVEEVRSNYPSDIGAIIFELSLNEEDIVENPPPTVAMLLDLYTRIVRILRNGKETFRNVLGLMGKRMAAEELLALRRELYGISKDESVLGTREPRSGCVREQKQATMNATQQIAARIAEIESAQNQPESLIQLMFY
ncbi:hypothetical protein NLG97_g1307 [Lecanicillium saksenae]|uniref:Uncharacterized protein n=1 Tax=Lecanicillium saksenae TaxID=468837 RepID=A0ACC1R439_9HYPO|nr:hypothetical protein NLG97_g1307 [Lecanicillium saksenae]